MTHLSATTEGRTSFPPPAGRAAGRPLGEEVSLYVDLLRILAAAAVLVHHASFVEFNGGWLGSTVYYGDDGVITFFVLSGFVIAYAAMTKENRLADFVVNRLSRLYSVVVPVLAITILADWIGIFADAALYKPAYGEFSLRAVLAALTFSNELWWQHLRPFSNGPYWSLSYEVAFYVIFAAFFYAPKRARLPVGLAALALAGPKILLLLPAWLMGYGAYRLHCRRAIRPGIGLVLFAGSLMLIAVYFDFGLRAVLLDAVKAVLPAHLVHDLHEARNFLAFWLLGGLVAINIAGFAAFAGERSILLGRAKRPIRAVANTTFCLYLLHYPLLHLFSATVKGLDGPVHTALMIAFTLFVVALLAPLTEGKKHVWRAWIRRAVNVLPRRRPALPA